LNNFFFFFFVFFFFFFFVQCLFYSQQLLYDWLQPYGYAQESSVPLVSDPCRGLRVNGNVKVRHGLRGARMEHERIVLVESCNDVILKPGLTLRGKKVYCIIYWNKVEVGRTEAKVAHPRLLSDTPMQQSGFIASAAIEEKPEVAVAGVAEDSPKHTDDQQSVSTPLTTETTAPMRRMAMANTKRFIDSTWSLDDYLSYVYFVLTPETVKTKEGPVFEAELVFDISKQEAARGSMMGRMS
jgi:hypothetical protein